jgi:hypothetical protein
VWKQSDLALEDGWGGNGPYRRNTAAGSPESLFHSAAVDCEGWDHPVLAAQWAALRALRGEVNRALEAARAAKLIRKNEEASVQLTLLPDGLGNQVSRPHRADAAEGPWHTSRESSDETSLH